MSEPDEDRRRLNEQADAIEREFLEQQKAGLDHGRLDFPERLVISPDSSPGHYAEAGRYAELAAAALDRKKPRRAQALAAIGQIHATLAVALVLNQEER